MLALSENEEISASDLPLASGEGGDAKSSTDLLIRSTAQRRLTLRELENHYIIEPAFAFWTGRSHAHDGARPVADGFLYTSDKNKHWLDSEGLGRMLGDSIPK